jgi:hypothetical protein
MAASPLFIIFQRIVQKDMFCFLASAQVAGWLWLVVAAPQVAPV